MTFSKRNKYDPKWDYEQILEDAPEWLRIQFCNEILSKFTYVDDDTRYKWEGQPLGIKSLHEKFCARIKEETEQNYYDAWFCWELLKDHIKATVWYQFYDFVELVGEELKRADDNTNFNIYRTEVNKLFSESKVSWLLSDESKLYRKMPKSLNDKMEEAAKKLDLYKPAKEHFKKAKRFLLEYPLDPENSIKEIISSIESLGRTLFSKATTLGDVIKEMRKQNFIPKMLIDILEKFYAYTCSQPAVRHGSPSESNLQLFDAEFCFQMGTSFILYILNIEKTKKDFL